MNVFFSNYYFMENCCWGNCISGIFSVDLAHCACVCFIELLLVVKTLDIWAVKENPFQFRNWIVIWTLGISRRWLVSGGERSNWRTCSLWPDWSTLTKLGVTLQFVFYKLFANSATRWVFLFSKIIQNIAKSYKIFNFSLF